MIFGEKPREKETTSWLGVAAWVLFIYLAIPFARSIQETLRDRFGKEFFLWVTLLSLAVAAGWIIRARVRKQWTGRPNQMLILIVTGGLFAWMTWLLRANPEESFHFVQYGVLSLLLFRALSHRLQDPSIYVAAALIGATFGIVDELIQWVVPRRYFDYRDIWINVRAAGLAQVALAAGLRPGFVRGPPSWAGIQLSFRAAICIGLLLLFCVSNTPRLKDLYSRYLPAAASIDQVTAEYGFRIEDPEIGAFSSRLPAEELRRRDREHGAEAAERISRARTDTQYVRFLEETPAHRDPLAVEARIHLFRRDRHALEALGRKDPEDARPYAQVAQQENQILTTYFPHTLDQSIFPWPETRTKRIEELSRGAPSHPSAVSNQLITRITQAQVSLILLLFLLMAGAGERWAARRIQR